MTRFGLLFITALLTAACTATPPMPFEEPIMAAPVSGPELTIERLFASPSLNGPSPRGVKFSPDGKRVTFLKAREEDQSRFDLWQFDVATGEQSMLVDSTLLEPEEVELSEEEKALRERKRIAGSRGIVSYDWGTADTILVPIGGDLHLVTVPPVSAGRSLQISLRPEAETYGLSLADVTRAIRQAYFGDLVYRAPREDDVSRPAPSPMPAASDVKLEDLIIETSDGRQVSAAKIASVETVSAPAETTVRRLTETEAFEYDARVSPDGSRVSFVRDGAVYAIELATGEETRLTPLAEPKNAISYGVAEFVALEEMSRYTGYWWSPDGRYLAYTRVDESTVDVIPRFDIAAEEVTVIQQRYPRAGRPNAVVDLFVRDLERGSVDEVNWRHDEWGPATDQYLTRVNWAGNALIVQAVNRDQTEIRATQHWPETLFAREAFFKEDQDNWANLNSDFMTLKSVAGNIHTQGELDILTTMENEGYRNIVEINKDGLQPVLMLGDWTVDSLLGLDREKGLIFFTGYKDTPLERHLYAVPLPVSAEELEKRGLEQLPDSACIDLEPTSARLQKSCPIPSRLTELGKSWSITMSPDGKSFVGTSSSPTQPSQTGLYRFLSEAEKWDAFREAGGGAQSSDTEPCEDLAPGSAALQIYCGPKTELIAWIEENALDETHPYFPYLESHTVPEYGTLTAEDGKTLYYSIQTPPDFDPAKQYPVLVEVYGGPHVQTVTRNWERMSDQFYSRQGYIVFRLDNRGSANRGKAFEDVIYRQTGGPEVRDQLVGVDWLKAQPFVDPERIAIQGWSYGGYMTLMTILQAPEGTFAAAVSGAPVTDWSLYDTFYTERYMDTPQDNPEGYEKSSVFYHLDRLEGDLTPLLLIHGMADDNVTFDNSTRLMASLQEAGQEFELMTYPGQRHGIRGEALQIHLMKTRMAFLNRHLQPGQ